MITTGGHKILCPYLEWRMWGRKMRMATRTEPKAVMSTMPAATSLAIFASCRCSLVIRSTIFSIDVFTISAEITSRIISPRILISYGDTSKTILATITKLPTIKWMRRFWSCENAYHKPSRACWNDRISREIFTIAIVSYVFSPLNATTCLRQM